MSFPWRPLVLMLVALSPTGLLGFFLINPDSNVGLNIPLEHFVVTTNVSIVALAVGLLVARASL